MRILKLNGVLVDIDNDTAIGIDIGTFDFKEPANRKLNVSNSFTLPRTKNNIALLGFSDSLQSTSDVCYQKISVNYSINGFEYIKNGKAEVLKITKNRIELNIVNETDFWDNLKAVSFNDLIIHCCDGVVLPDNSISYPYDIDLFIDTLKNDFGVEMLYYFGIDGIKSLYYLTLPLTQYTTSEFVDNKIRNYSKFSIKLSKVIQCINKYYLDTYNIQPINTNSPLFDAVFESIYIPIWQFMPTSSGANLFFTQTSDFDLKDIVYGNDLENVNQFNKVTVFDFVKAILQAFGASFNVVDGVYSFYRLSDINQVPAVNWSGKLIDSEFAPIISGFEQVNYVNYKSTFDGGNVRDNGCIIQCLNENLDKEKELISINATYTPRISFQNDANPFTPTDYYIPFFDKEEQFNAFVFLVKKPPFILDVVTISQKVKIFEAISADEIDIPIAQAYGLGSEYSFHKQICAKPKVYNVKMWLNSFNLNEFDQSKLVYIRELGGTFFVNKIKGFNPDKSKQSVDVELIFVNYATIQTIDSVTYYVDGIETPYVDGVGSIYR